MANRGGIKKLRNLNAHETSNYIEIEVLMRDSSSKPHETWSYKLQFNSAPAAQENRNVNISLESITKNGESLLLLEEPELYLHSEIVKQLPMFIANAQAKRDGRCRQVIISSHSYDLLNTDTISPEEIVVLKTGKEDTTAEIASEIESVKNKINAGFTPADAVIPQVTPKGIADGQLSFLELL